jgi:hypothetical protein
LQSIEELVVAVTGALDSAGRSDDTYFFFTSDHGFHLGQFGLTLDKRTIYDFDLRVPLLVRGPGVPQAAISDALVVSIDVAPTLLDIAGLKAPSDMDGVSFFSVLKGVEASMRTDFLVEYHGEIMAADGSLPCGNYTGLQCLTRGPSSFVRPPLFYGSKFCECEDAANNTYSCVRTLNAATGVNSQYCEFSYGFRERYDLEQDPFQLKNLALDHVSVELSQRLRELQSCWGTSCMQTT